MFKSMTFEIVGGQRLTCGSCEQRVEHFVKAMQGVRQAHAQARNQRIEVLFDSSVLDATAITERIRDAGYQTKVVGSDSVIKTQAPTIPSTQSTGREEQGAIESVGHRSHRSADLQSAVSPIPNRQRVEQFDAFSPLEATQAGSTAIQQTGSLRYGARHFQSYPEEHVSGNSPPKTVRKWLSAVASVFSSVLAIVCPACIPAVGAFLASIGLGFAVRTSVLQPLLIVLLAANLAALVWSAKLHRRWWVLVTGALGAAMIYAGRYVWFSEPLLWVGAATLIGTSIANFRIKRACCRGERQPAT